MSIVYLDSSAIVKCYVLEPGSDIVSKVYLKALSGELLLSFLAWNIRRFSGCWINTIGRMARCTGL